MEYAADKTDELATVCREGFSKSDLKDAIDKIPSTIESESKKLNEKLDIKETVTKIPSTIEAESKKICESVDKIYTVIDNLKKSIGEGFGIPTYATGGFPEDGWFRASHGEIMGTFDNGQSVVANNDQITNGIAQAVSQSLVPLLTDIAESSRETANKDFSVDIDSREIARSANNGQQKLGRALISFS